MSEMVERIAKSQAGSRWDTFDEEHKDAARELARTAIHAMREPTDAMVEAGWNAPGDQPQTHWQAMIDEALK